MNLIPEDYKRYLQQLHILQLWGVTVMVVIVISISTSFTLNYKVNEYQKKIVILEKKKAISSHQRNLLKALEKNHTQLSKKHETLNKLRGGALAENMFLTIDKVLAGNDVWFKNWRFDRAGNRASEQEETVNTGYFIVIPVTDNANKKRKESWRIYTRMEVNGEARDHSALSSFVRRLLQQPQIGDVSILNTQQRSYADKTVVSFKLMITVNSRYSNT